MHDFSIVIPTYGNPNGLIRLLESLAALSYSHSRFEVIVVDDGSRTPISASVAAFHDRMTLRIFRQHNMGPASARNRGVEMATGRYLAFTDDDCRVHPEWLHALAAALDEADQSICGGKTVNSLTDSIYSEASQLIADHLSEHYSPMDSSGGFFPCNNMAVSRSGFLKIGGFDPCLRYGEDRDLCYRGTASGFSFIHAPDALVYHSHHQNLLSFVGLHQKYGKGTWLFRRGCRRKGLPPVPINSLFWYLNLISAGIRKSKTPRGIALSLLLIASQIATLSGMLNVILLDRKQRTTASWK